MTNPLDPYGSDVAVTFVNVNGTTVIDMDPTGREVTGIDVLVQSLVMRQTSPQGACLAAPVDCIDLRGLISKGLTLSAIQRIGAQVQAQILRDSRVKSAKITPSFSLSSSTLTLVEQIVPFVGQAFTLTLSVSATGAVSFLVANNGQS